MNFTPEQVDLIVQRVVAQLGPGAVTAATARLDAAGEFTLLLVRWQRERERSKVAQRHELLRSATVGLTDYVVEVITAQSDYVTLLCNDINLNQQRNFYTQPKL